METIHQIRITLNGTKPSIWRRVAVAADITLGQLHEVIQIVMGWTDSHLHHFILRDKKLKPTPQEMAKRFQQDAWDEDFLGRMRGERYFVTKVTPWGEPTEMEGEDENAVTLGEVCPKVKSKLIYEYDFGDGWEHVIEVQKIVEPEDGVEYPVCLAGKKACPPEDCGGVWGYYELLETIADHEHEQHEEMLEWLGGEFDPDAFDLEEVNTVLARWRGRD
ncbi:MAG: plasmid pRiA4b ORF-3 family protein [Phycisphaerae bacterium]|nr:plasmid pRiA4b ORF-3 family protein [Phycisphaerae bacterium]